MKMYLITQAQLDELPRRIELASLRENEFRDVHDPVICATKELVRIINLHVRTWMVEVSSDR